MKSVTLRAYAKINISLDVTGKREDGYHLLRSVFQGISLYDDIRVIRKEEGEGIEITCNLPYIPTDERNIVHKVATAFFKAAGMTDYSIAIDLKKAIPSGAGLGGGSADGAAVFSALCRLYGIFFSKKEATEILTPLGADIPFFLYSGTMLAEGVGEILSPLPALPDCFIVLAKPRASANTKQIFSALAEKGIPRHPDTDLVIRGLEQGNLALIAQGAGNVLENVTIPLCPPVGKLKEAMQKQGALLSLMTGSGSTVFGIFQEEKDARKAARVMQRYTRTVFTVRPICRPMKTEE
jgi:4-diphosphocytidyl-2-C-methyl-D-erythritol kinase